MASGRPLTIRPAGPCVGRGHGKMPRERCLSLGVEASNSDTGAGKIMEVLQTNLAPDASGAGFRDITAFFGLRRPHFKLDAHLSRFEMARRRAEARLPRNGIFPDIMLPPLRLRPAGLTPNQKSMIPSSAGGDPSLETMRRHMRRISQPLRGGAETGCPRGEGRLAQHAGAPIPASGKQALGR